MKLKELHEQVQWATGPNIQHAQPMARRYQSSERDDYVLVEVNIVRLLKSIPEDMQMDMSSEEGGGKTMRNRIPRAKKHWQTGQFMDPPIAGFNEWTNNFEITDGRHRLVAAYQMGERIAPILIPASSLEIFKERLGAREL